MPTENIIRPRGGNRSSLGEKMELKDTEIKLTRLSVWDVGAGGE